MDGKALGGYGELFEKHRMGLLSSALWIIVTNISKKNKFNQIFSYYLLTKYIMSCLYVHVFQL